MCNTVSDDAATSGTDEVSPGTSAVLKLGRVEDDLKPSADQHLQNASL